MNFNRLRYFVKVAELQNFHRASEVLNIAQPALTRQVRQLEAELGIQLLDRRPRGVRLTQPGENFLVGAKRVLADVEELMQSARRDSENLVGELWVAFEDSVSQNPIIAQALQIIRMNNSRLTVRLVPLSERHQIEQLRNRELDIGFAFDSCGEFSRHQELVCHSLEQEELVLVIPVDHPLNALPTIHVEDLVDEPFVMIAKEKAPKQGYNFLIDTCEAAGLTPRIVQEVHSIDGLFNLVSVGVGITMCARGVRSHLPQNVTMRRVEGLEIAFDFTMMWRRSSSSAATRKFVEIVKSIQKGKARSAPPILSDAGEAARIH